MAMNNDKLSFGKYLRSFRREKGIRLEEISAATKISMHVLSHIEKEDHSQLPNSAVVKSFLRLYADYVDADQNTVINGYMDSLKEDTAAVSSKGKIGKSVKFWGHILLSFGLFVGIVLVSVYYVPDKKEHNKEPESAVAVKNADIPETIVIPEPVEKLEPAPVADTNMSEKHKLLIQAVDDTWVKLIIDGKLPEAYTLASGDQLELEALSSFNILIGNAGGVKLTLNEKPVRVSGKSGQVLTLQLP